MLQAVLRAARMQLGPAVASRAAGELQGPVDKQGRRRRSLEIDVTTAAWRLTSRSQSLTASRQSASATLTVVLPALPVPACALSARDTPGPPSSWCGDDPALFPLHHRWRLHPLEP